ncbi:hypothetical protein XA68_11248 [Ophiocordyceps unilateralis]|uniref:Clr5 domain-containing protein n=1 Tax=Ophiocordyceps unilateralis TaxID=268505 RepID=A0A2A9PGW6_OPHUN|nr:hypothetical protein XA68_11248 [Ophiocordyceps unilateralis]
MSHQPSLPSPAEAGSPSAASAGRPSLWTRSAERKLARLYVYTTLPLETIVKLVHSRQREAGPGIDSANRKLRSLLDKEPRWLHPRNESDMGRRLTELSNSPTRTAAADGSPTADEYMFLSPFDIPLQSSASPMSFRSEPFEPIAHSSDWQHHRGISQPPFRSSASPGNATDGAAFVPFLRQTTYLSTSTACTTGSFRQMLPQYSEPYVLAVKRLVKRFTAPIMARAGLRSDPEMVAPASGPHTFFCDAHPLPGHLLYRDMFIPGCPCHSLPGSHRWHHCVCRDRIDNFVSPWIAPDGMTAVGHRIRDSGPTRLDVSARDSVGNTVMHFVAARGRLELLFRILPSSPCGPLLNERNTGGQSFLHVISRSHMRDVAQFQRLLLLASRHGVDVYAPDVYGRTIFHVLRLAGHSPDTVARIASQFHGEIVDRRDAFGLVPTADPMDFEPDSSPDAIQEPELAIETQRLAMIGLALENPWVQDAEGRNGLHCLAVAILSPASLALKCGLTPAPEDRRGNRHDPSQVIDSSSARLEARYELAKGLLEAGVDPNQYDLAGNTPIMAFAAELPEDDDYKIGPNILALLIEHGARVDARNRAGETALHVAVRHGRKLATRTLIHNKASVHVRDARGRSLLEVADAMTEACGSGSEYAHYEACRAWLSGDMGKAVQKPELLDEWSRL